jgi:hypothetical protein
MDGQASVAVGPGAITLAPDISCVHGFAEADIVENRAGRLSATQLRSARRRVRGFAFAVAMAVGLAIFFYRTNGAGFIWLITVGIAIPVGIHRLWQAICDVRNPMIDFVEGNISIECDEDSYFLRSDDKRFNLSEKAYTALRSGGPYRVFFLGRTNWVVGVEILPGWQPAPSKVAKRRFPFSIEIG